MSGMRFIRWCGFLVCLLNFAPSLRAHQVASVELEFRKLDAEWSLAGEMDVAYMLPETRKIPGGPALSRQAVMRSSAAEFERIRRETEATLRMLLRFTFGGKELPWRIEFPDFKKTPFALPEEAGDVALLSVHLWIILVRLRSEGAAGQALGQAQPHTRRLLHSRSRASAGWLRMPRPRPSTLVRRAFSGAV
jgi:hypothetical protein